MRTIVTMSNRCKAVAGAALLLGFGHAFAQGTSAATPVAGSATGASVVDHGADSASLAQWLALGVELARKATHTAKTVATVRTRSRVTLAMFEAANASERRYASYVGLAADAPDASGAAAVAAAGHAVLEQLYPAAKARLDRTYLQALDGIAEGQAKTAGIEVGLKAAAAALRQGGLAPDIRVVPYRPATAPGVWESTIVPIIEPFETALTPWFMSRADAFRPPGPPPLKSRRYALDYNEITEFGARDSRKRTAEQTRMALFWDNVDPLPVLRQVASTGGRSLVRNARLYALWSMAMDDADLAVADAKLHFAAWRPFTAVRNGDRDGNPATRRQADWEPLIYTPWHPEYPCWHCISAATTAAVLQAELGADRDRRLHFVSVSLPGEERELSLQEYVREVSLSRIYAGLHFRSSCNDAEAMGRRIAGLAMGRFAPSVGAARPSDANKHGGTPQ